MTDAADSSLRGWVKYDAHSLYFGLEVLDDYLHGIDGPRWCPAGNPACEQLTPQGWPWFGDGVEVLINAAGRQHPVPLASTVVGNSTQWQMVCSLTKSRLGGVGTGGLCEGEPRQSSDAWHTYRRWIDTGAMRCAAQPRRTPRGFVVEFAVRFALLQLSPGRPYHTGMPHTALGLNLALSDVRLTSQQPRHTSQQPRHTSQQPRHTSQQPHPPSARPLPAAPPQATAPSSSARPHLK